MPIFRLLVLAVFLTSACETNPFSSDSKKPEITRKDKGSGAAEEELVHITRISYTTKENETAIRVYSSGKFQFTSYKLADPLRLAVEMPGVVLDFPPKRIEVNDEISYLSVVRFPKVNSVRLEIELLDDVPFNIIQKPEFLEILVAHSSKRRGKKSDMMSAPAAVQHASMKAEKLKGKIDELELENEKLKQENKINLETVVKLEEENTILREQVIEAGKQLDQTSSLTETLQARIEFMESKLNELQEKVSERKDSAIPPPSLFVGRNAANTASPPEPSKAKQGTDDTPLRLIENAKEVEEMIEEWINAWTGKDIKKYSSFYTPDYRLKTMTHRQWLADKREKFQRQEYIEVEAANLRISFDGGDAKAVFEQAYRSPTYRDEGIKTLTLTKTGNNWKITEENWEPL